MNTTTTTRPPLIQFLSGYRGEHDFEVHHRGEHYRITYRHSPEEYEGGSWNYTPEEFERDVNGCVGIVHRSGAPVEAEVLELFRLRIEEKNRQRAEYLAQGIDIGRALPEPVTGRYVRGEGWERIPNQ